MIERHVTFDVLPGKGKDFESFFFKAYRPTMSIMPGFVRVELLREQENLEHYQMVIRFESAEAAADWRSSEAHKALQPELKALYSASRLEVYEVIE